MWRRSGLRRPWMMAATVMTAALTAAACSTPASPATPAASGGQPAAAPGQAAAPAAQVKKGGILRYIQSMDPADADTHTAVTSNGVFWEPVGEHFLDINYSTYDVIPGMAESWKVSSDGMTWEFKLRQGVKWHNKPPASGREATAEDIVANFKRVTTPEPQFIHGSLYSAASSFEAVDKYTVKITTKHRDAAFLSNLAANKIYMAAPEAWQQFGNLKRPEVSAIGTGPMMLEEWTPSVGAKFKRNPDYWGAAQGKPYLDGAQFSIVKDKNARVAALRTGKVDYLTAIDLPDKEDLVKSTPQLQWAKPPQSPNTTLRLDLFKAPFNDIKVRRAINLAIDRDEIIKLVMQGDGEVGSAVPFWISKWTLPQEELKKRPEFGGMPMDQRVAEAKKLLAEAGVSSGFSFPCLAGTGSRTAIAVATVVQDQLKRNLGLDMKLETIDLGVVQKAHTDGNFTCTVYSQSSGIDPNEYLHFFYHRDGTRNYQKWDDPKYNAMVEAQMGELDEAKRLKIVQEAQRYIMDAEVQPMLLQYYGWVGVYPYLKNITPANSLGGIGKFEDMWLDK